MNEKEKTDASRFMSLILRHDPQKIGITFEHDGWADTNALIDGMNRAGYHITLEGLKEIVTTNNKQRFKFNDDYSKIRANQGHSIDVDVALQETEPPAVLYHGTAAKYIQAIKDEGLISKSRLYVHLSSDRETAVNVGARHGKPVVLTIDSAGMSKNGFKFYLSDNKVWLTKSVPTEYIM
jgi:putative RNA 2'-phosphotransferase